MDLTKDRCCSSESFELTDGFPLREHEVSIKTMSQILIS